MTAPTLPDAARRITAQLDQRGNPALTGLPETLCRALKVQEEAGEMAQAVIGVLGQNPRKGVTHTWDDVITEAIDVVMSALVFAETVTREHLEDTLAERIGARLDHLARRAAASAAPDVDPAPADTAGTKPRAVHADLHRLAEFLAANPMCGGQITHYVFADCDSVGLAEVARIAAALDVPVTDSTGQPTTATTEHFYAQRRFGPFSYRAIYITDARMAAHDARNSYSGNIRIDTLAEAAR